MTTIAAKDGILAADTQLTWGGYVLRIQKVFALPDGGVASGSGDWARAYAGIQWLIDGEQGDPPSIKGADIVVIRPDGVIWMTCGAWPLFPIMDKSFAMGAGSDLARMAMDDGLSAVDAVTRATKLDNSTSGPVQSVAILPPVTAAQKVKTHTPRKGRK